MPVWHLTIDLSPIWRGGDKPFTWRRDAIVEVLKTSAWREDLTADKDDFDYLLQTLAEAENAREFDLAFSEVYDLADEEQVWIETS